MSLEKILEKIRSLDGVLAVHVMDKSTSLMLDYYESKNSAPGCRYYNLALSQGRTMDIKLCIFSEQIIGQRTKIITYQDDGYSEGSGESFSDVSSDPGYGCTVLSKPRSLYSSVGSVPSRWFIVAPHEFEFLDVSDGVKESVAFNPLYSTDRFLKERLNFSGPDKAVSTIVSLNLL